MQQTFLQEAAARLYERYGDDISSLRIVLPSRRARLFFSDALSALTSRPIWQPRYISMDDIMSRYSTLAVGEKLRLITELYRIYSDYPPHEPFDKFYFWGEILLSDFDLIDKYMIDADMLFRNLCDIKEIEADLSYLSEDMRRVIHAFWSHFADTAALSTEKRIFLDRWLSLAPIYHRLRERLTSLGIAYTGMIYRSAVENIEQGNTPEEEDFRYVFIGFNALSECERRVLKYLDRQGRCDFLWDYDSFYTEDKNQEAGYFLRDNIREFKPLDDITHDNFLSINKKINAISCVSNVVQCKHVNSLLQEISPSLTFDKQTAIVLTDESLLQPLLHSLPQSVAENVNVTMGYPLRQTTAYSLIERLIELQKRCRTGSQTSFYHADVVGILSHPYLNDSLGEVASKLREQIIKGRFIRIEQEFFNVHESLCVIFSPAERYSSLSKYLLQALNTVAQLIPKGEEQSRQISYLSLIADNISDLNNVIKDCQIELSNSIYTSLLRRHLQSVRIPFSGEPLQGLQVMGILETRNIDFRNVILLSASDDNFPGKIGSASSFIPYNLRAAYGIPTPEHHESVYAYYFYRLLQRAERIDILYCSHADEKSTGEQSRYIYQLDYESPYTVHRTNVGVDVALDQPTERIIEKRGRIAEALQRYVCADGARAERRLSPSAFSQYISCPMRFYLSAIARIKLSDTLSEDVDHPMFGNILHSAMQRLYSPLAGVANPATDLEHLLSSHSVERAVKDAIDKEYLNKENADQSEYTGTLLLVRDIITKYIRQGIIPYDKRHNDFAVKSCEEKIYTPFTLSNSQQVEIGGIADRIDSLDSGALRVVDYKTGRAHLKASTIEDIFEGEKRDEMKYLFQTMLYSMVLHHSLSREVVPSLYYARDMNQPSYSPRLIIDRQEVTYSAFAVEFEKLLRQKLDELFDLHTPFKCCPEQESGKICAYCDFKTICKR
ncbi:MAG: PD-(D/E)XK nuclease family protein [Alistipes sp.]|nr:PD-(D/E)XK nuclease family protein [Alistipes sp.]